MIESSASLEVRMIVASSRCSSSSSLRSSSPLIPITAFIGVRISWLIAARNVLLAALAASAASRASWALAYSRALSSAIMASWANRCEPLDLGLRERPLIGGVASDSERAERRVARLQRNAYHRADPAAGEARYALVPAVVVAHHGGLERLHHATGQTFALGDGEVTLVGEHAHRGPGLEQLAGLAQHVDVSVVGRRAARSRARAPRAGDRRCRADASRPARSRAGPRARRFAVPAPRCDPPPAAPAPPGYPAAVRSCR